ncbi:MAG: hypothetical protein QF368_13835 [SAR202 cluster bacterium]|jgi:hypothetical protein|nr:hypothetical protein [SAR202 cluster bacterium]
MPNQDSGRRDAGARRDRKPIVWIVLFVFCALASAIVGGCGNDDGDGDVAIQDNLKVKNLEIVDDDGITRAVFTTISGGRPSLTLLDNSGDFRAWLTLNDDGSPNLVLIDQGRVVLMDSVGGVRSTYSLDGTNSPSMSHFSEDGVMRFSAGLNEEGVPAAELIDEIGEVVWSAQ